MGSPRTALGTTDVSVGRGRRHARVPWTSQVSTRTSGIPPHAQHNPLLEIGYLGAPRACRRPLLAQAVDRPAAQGPMVARVGARSHVPSCGGDCGAGQPPCTAGWSASPGPKGPSGLLASSSAAGGLADVVVLHQVVGVDPHDIAAAGDLPIGRSSGLVDRILGRCSRRSGMQASRSSSASSSSRAAFGRHGLQRVITPAATWPPISRSTAANTCVRAPRWPAQLNRPPRAPNLHQTSGRDPAGSPPTRA